jgi:hypothetical protein
MAKKHKHHMMDAVAVMGRRDFATVSISPQMVDTETPDPVVDAVRVMRIREINRDEGYRNLLELILP